MEYMSDISHSSDAYRPSLFELIAEEKMSAMVRPAFKYVLTVYAQRYPRYLLRAVNRFDELYALVMLGVESHYLHHTGGTFAENFYGLKRATRGRRRGVVPAVAAYAAKTKRESGLSPVDVRRSLVFLVGIPYVKAKLDDLYDEVSGRTRTLLFGNHFEDNPGDERNSHRPSYQPLPCREWCKRLAKSLLRRGYPWVNAAWHMTVLAYYIAYLYEATPYFSPWLHVVGLEIRRKNMDDYRDAALRDRLAYKAFPSRSSQLSPSAFARVFIVALLSRGLDFLKVVFPTAIFFFRFLEWWYALNLNTVSQQQPIPQPPETLKPHPDGIPLPEDPTVCPLCHRKRTNAAATSSGYVFCYPCIFRHVSQRGECPVTKLPCDAEALRRIYAVAV